MKGKVGGDARPAVTERQPSLNAGTPVRCSRLAVLVSYLHRMPEHCLSFPSFPMGTETQRGYLHSQGLLTGREQAGFKPTGMT